ncbi:unnamed protein product [Dibothriocephalus latus]|uniref:Uncharacterized protein n=1 Tax=Dibothriocephalus latus TaxID=60516 RepID=A0A3P6UAC6_DIBLA|nr:unnamed protein product [Dibothriocephalus latus]
MVQNPNAVAETIARKIRQMEAAVMKQSATTEQMPDLGSPADERQFVDGAEEEAVQVAKEQVNFKNMVPKSKQNSIKFP